LLFPVQYRLECNHLDGFMPSGRTPQGISVSAVFTSLRGERVPFCNRCVPKDGVNNSKRRFIVINFWFDV
jgi:hypothetical protein